MPIPGYGSLDEDKVDHWAAYELPVGMALAVRLGLNGVLGTGASLAILVSVVLLAGAGWWAWQREHNMQKAAGAGRRIVLMTRGFWLALLVATLLTFGLVALALEHGLSWFPRWEPWPMICGLWLGLFWLTLGAQASRSRHVYLGLWLCAVSGIWPGLPLSAGWQRYAAAAVCLGGAMLFSGWLRQRKPS